jgi:hypothetical protein
MSSLILNGDTSGAVTLSVPAVAGSSTVTLPSTTGNISVMPTGYTAGAGDTSRFKNRIINGDMRIDQRNNGASGTALGYTIDRFAYDASQASKFTWQQNAGSVTPPVGFSNYLGFTSSSAYSVGTGDYFYIYHRIEGFNSVDLAWGTANAKTVTLSFWVRSSLTGTFGGSLRNGASNYSYPFTYTISSANTWTQINVTIAGPTAGTWLGATNGIGVQVLFGLGSGSTYNGTAGAWAGSNYLSSIGATSVVGTSGATWYVTGVQLEVGSQATSFEYVDYGTQLVQCQRYYEVGSFTQRAAASNGNYVGQFFPFSVTKRTGPSMAASGTSYPYNCSALSLAGGYSSGFEMYVLASGPYAVSSSWSASAEL